MNIEQHNFITQYLRHSSAYTAYCIAYNVEDQSQYESIMSAAQQLMDDPEVGGVIRSVLDGVRHDVEQEIRAQQKTELLTVQSKRELLARIARGELTAVQHYKGKDCNHCTQMVLPTINQMLKAIDLDSKLAGHYLAEKRQSTVDSLQLTKSENTSETQPRLGEAIKEQNFLPEKGLGKADLQNTENTTMLQQNATTHISLAGGVKYSHIVNLFQGEAWIKNSQNHNKTQQISPSLPSLSRVQRGRG